MDTAWLVAQRVVFNIPLLQQEQDTKLATLFAPKKDPPPVILSNSSWEELPTREERETRGEKNFNSIDQSSAQENIPVPSEQTKCYYLPS